MKKKFVPISEYVSQLSVELKKDATLKANPGIAKVIGDIDQILSRMEVYVHTETSRLKVVNTYLNECRKKLNESAFLAASNLRSCGARIRDAKIEAEGMATSPFISRLSTPKIIQLSDHLYQAVSTNADALAQQSYTATDATTLLGYITNVKECANEKVQIKQSANRSALQSQILLKQLMTQIKELDIHMASIQQKSISSFTTYKKIRTQINHANVGKRLLMATVCSKATKAPLTSARVVLIHDVDEETFSQLESGVSHKKLKIKPVCTKKTSPRGRFNILRMTEGSYVAIITMHGYKPTVVRIYINLQNTFKLNVELLPVD